MSLLIQTLRYIFGLFNDIFLHDDYKQLYKPLFRIYFYILVL